MAWEWSCLKMESGDDGGEARASSSGGPKAV